MIKSLAQFINFLDNKKLTNFRKVRNNTCRVRTLAKLMSAITDFLILSFRVHENTLAGMPNHPPTPSKKTFHRMLKNGLYKIKLVY